MFDAIAGFVERLVISVLDLAVLLLRDDGLGSARLNEVAQFIAVVATVGNDGSGFRCYFETRLGWHIVADIARCQNQNDWAAFVVGDRMNLALAAATRGSYAAIRPPFYARFQPCGAP
jgi:hypothetical protein